MISSPFLGGLRCLALLPLDMGVEPKAHHRDGVAQQLLARDHVPHQDAHPHQQSVLDAANHLERQAAGDLDGKGGAEVDHEAHEDGCQIVQRLAGHQGQAVGQQPLALPYG